MSAIASLFESCSAVVPQFKVVTKREIKTQAEVSKKLTGAERRIKQKAERQQKTKKLTEERAHDSREARTVFVGNISLPCNRKLIKQLFKEYGKVETVRFRSFKVKPGDLPTKVALRRQTQLVDGSTCNAYVVLASEEEAENSLELSGTLFHGRHLRVDMLGKSKHRTKDSLINSVFVGNLPFSADEEKLREVFASCGEVMAVRIIRDKKTGTGKGFGFVTFSEKSGVMFAVQQSRKLELEGRPLRVFKAKSEEALKMKSFSGIRSSRPLQKTKSKKKAKLHPTRIL